MNVKFFSKRLFFVPILTCAVFSLLVLKGATQYSPEEYEVYQSAVNAPPEEREDAIIQFVGENPKSALVEYAASEYVKLMQSYQGQGGFGKAVDAGKRMLELLPEDLDILSALLHVTSESALQAQRFQEAILYGEKLYSVKPSPSVAYILAYSYRPLEDYEKYAEYGQIACQSLEALNCHAIALDLTKRLANQQEFGKAAKYAQQAIDGLDPSDSENIVEVYRVLGRSAFEEEAWNVSIANYQKVVDASSDKTTQAEAYYRMGMSQWKLKDLDATQESFAKGSANQTQWQKHCRQQLEFIYKSTHNGSLAGLDEFVERVTR